MDHESDSNLIELSVMEKINDNNNNNNNNNINSNNSNEKKLENRLL